MGGKKDRLDEILRRYFQSRHRPGIDAGAEEHFEVIHAEMRVPEEIPLHRAKFSMHSITDHPPPCPSSRVLGAYIDGTLSKEEKDSVRKHLRRCPNCRRITKTGSDVVSSSKEGKSEKVPDRMSSETSSSLSDLYRKSRSRKKSSEDL